MKADRKHPEYLVLRRMAHTIRRRFMRVERGDGEVRLRCWEPGAGSTIRYCFAERVSGVADTVARRLARSAKERADARAGALRLDWAYHHDSGDHGPRGWYAMGPHSLVYVGTSLEQVAREELGIPKEWKP